MSDRRAAADERRARRAVVDDPAVVMEAAAAFLSVRQRSVAETRRRLRHLGYRPALVEEVVTRLVEMGYLDDESFARAWLESRDRARPRGEAALRRELALKGIDASTIAAVIEERRAASGEDADAPGGRADTSADREAAERLLERRAPALLRESDERRRRQKAYALLARNGFDPDTCREVAARWLELAGRDVVLPRGPGRRPPIPDETHNGESLPSRQPRGQ